MKGVKLFSVVLCSMYLAFAVEARHTERVEDNAESWERKSITLLQLLLMQGSTREITRRLALASSFSSLAPIAARAIVKSGDHLGDTRRPCTTEFQGQKTIETCLEYGLTKEGNLAKCDRFAQCIATNSGAAPEKFASAWVPNKASSEAKNATRAWRALVSAVRDQDGLSIVEQNDEDFYLRATAASALPKDGTDDVEFRITGESPPFIIFRSGTRQSVFVSSIDTPLSNLESHRARLKQIRFSLGWEEANASPEIEEPPNLLGFKLFGDKIPDFDDDY